MWPVGRRLESPDVAHVQSIHWQQLFVLQKHTTQHFAVPVAWLKIWTRFYPATHIQQQMSKHEAF